MIFEFADDDPVKSGLISIHTANITQYGGLILGLRQANEECRYKVETPSLIGWAQKQNQHWYGFMPLFTWSHGMAVIILSYAPICLITVPLRINVKLRLVDDIINLLIAWYATNIFTYEKVWLT